jgi:hypothetical protein
LRPGDAAPGQAPPENHCLNCSATLRGRFCHECGQKSIEPEERRIGWFLAQLLKALTMVDGRFLGSLGRLVFRPGVLDRDWLAGRRRRHLAPLSLFLIANLLYFFYPQLTDLNLSLADQLSSQPHSALARTLVAAKVEARGLGLLDYAALYEARSTEVAKLMVILHAPLLAAALLLLHFRRGIFFVDHLAVSLHFWAFMLFMIMSVPWLLGLLVRATGLALPGLLQVTLLSLTSLYGWQQLRVAYGQPGWLALAKLPLLLLGFALAHMVYRAVHFLAAYALS